MNKLKSLIPYVIIIIVVMLFRTFIATFVIVVGPSMQNTLVNGDYMVLDKISYRFTDIKRFDIVVIRTERESIIKRVIGLPGEELYIKDGDVYINGNYLKQDFNYIKSTDSFIIEDFGETIIPKDTYIVLGDNRDNSFDSRKFGFVPKESIVGKTSFVLFPFKQFGIKE